MLQPSLLFEDWLKLWEIIGGWEDRCGGFLIWEDVMVTMAHCNGNLGDKAKLTQTVGTILRSQKKVKKGAVCSVAGWAQTSIKTNKKPSLTLQEVALTVMGKKCSPPFAWTSVTPCLVFASQGNSKAPPVCNGKAQGIVSHGSGDRSTPSVFTRLSKYVCWIKKTATFASQMSRYCPEGNLLL
uniref:Peptidase S1 domain-containing protein n=1 Tax=Gopherus agassizii TaxID=38772 RepID=A0A452IJ73_9SAUR